MASAMVAVMLVVGMLVAPASAGASSLAYVKGGNVWLAHPDGSGQYQVTRDGTSGDPYRSVSEADDGTLVAARGKRIYRMRQNGQLLNAPIPVAAPTKTEPLPQDITSPLPDDQTSPPNDLSVTPDGTKVAFWYETTCYESIGVINGYVPCPAVGFTYANRFTAPRELGHYGSGLDPYMFSNSRGVMAADRGTDIWVIETPAPDDKATFWLRNCPDGTNCMGASDPAVSRSGKRIVVVSTDENGNASKLDFYQSQTGPPPHGQPPPDSEPTPKCEAANPVGEFSEPVWSPDGMSLAWAEGDGIHVGAVPDLDNCATATDNLVIPGGSNPSWSPADVNPPVVVAISVPATRLGPALAHGLKVSVVSTAAGRARLVALASGRQVASALGSFPSAGSYAVRLAFTAKAKRAFAHVRRLRLTIRLTVRGADGKTVRSSRSVTLRR